MKGEDYKPTGMEKLVAQWPAFAGLLCIAAGLGYVWYAKTYPPHILYTRPVIVMVGGGVVLILYWALASDRGGSSY
ncbi:MAG TPA: hypothetical protein VER17_02510 [Tepidisphaeraceae bacterium]|nr:hypothetical protein [Tepidisphaeraceae bacterium]